MTGARLATRSGGRSVHAVFELVLACACPQCSAGPGVVCAFNAATSGVAGAHLGRFAAARRRDLITAADLTVVLAAAASMFTATTVIYDDQLTGCDHITGPDADRRPVVGGGGNGAR